MRCELAIIAQDIRYAQRDKGGRLHRSVSIGKSNSNAQRDMSGSNPQCRACHSHPHIKTRNAFARVHEYPPLSVPGLQAEARVSNAIR